MTKSLREKFVIVTRVILAQNVTNARPVFMETPMSKEVDVSDANVMEISIWLREHVTQDQENVFSVIEILREIIAKFVITDIFRMELVVVNPVVVVRMVLIPLIALMGYADVIRLLASVTA